ncbi:bifunctional glutamate N-acetyltransferase/amino-acid acetyltransferase ArgJ [Lacipirellula parvula]|uniref:Arginine biosynthesis bifunctional protein ArgJ n=1 Tax=Lacipirellula parvula TaxID=2650471 RepID=A0A5K7X990_9BACT|nr:bifunctional glutamate N-acetyltransferase/amino-acid acetyltransferase ArgJ [Lacipirellula parvula]BBO32467.1 glutamate N-acetyltransferase [Lacipirellula parvula]
MPEQLPKGFRAAGIYSGVKENTSRLDLSLLVSDAPCVAAGVYTQNLVFAAPVKLCRERTPSETVRAVVINSGNANACTGDLGDRDAKAMAARVAEVCGFADTDVLVLSTGVIGELMPMEKIIPGIEKVATFLGRDEDSLVNAARGMMTTDTRPKISSRIVTIDGQTISICGVAKGAAMIGPNLATMLAVVMTDARISLQDAQEGLKDAADESFNCISVEGHTSTNDSVLFLANGAAGGPELKGDALAKFQATLVEVCEDLAQSIPADGEGASHLITVEVHGCRTRDEAIQIAKTVADSPLVKTAIAGNDPNWGRIVSAAGYAGVQFDASKVCLHLNGSLLYERGQPVPFDGDAVSREMEADRNTGVVLLFDEGEASARFWTSDLTAEYVRLNADYRT